MKKKIIKIEDVKKLNYNEFWKVANNSYMIESGYPRRPWISPHLNGDIPINRSIYPFREEIRPEEFEIKKDHIIRKGVKLNKYLESPWRSKDICLHFSTDRKVWEYDWQKFVIENTELRDNCNYYFALKNVKDLSELTTSLDNYKIHYQYKIERRWKGKESDYDILLKINLGYKTYIKFRKWLIDIHKLGYSIRYVYEEIRNTVTNDTVNVII